MSQGSGTPSWRIAAIRLLCPDPSRTAAFYEAAFAARLTPTGDGVDVAIGRQVIQLRRTGAVRGQPAPSNATTFQHCALIVPDMAAATARLDGLPDWSAISRAGPERLPATSGGVTAWKFRDPDGHPLEFLAFPPDEAPPAWRDADGGPVLGIDHTAITVSDTARALAFYEDLGFTVTSRSVNQGEEQARLDDVAEPRVEVTGLSPPGGSPPHLELLCYRRPEVITRRLSDGDVLATLTIFAAPGAGPLEATDPDGHRLLFAGA